MAAKKKNKDNSGALIVLGLTAFLLLAKPKGDLSSPTGSGSGSGSGSGGIKSKYYTISDVQRSDIGKEQNIQEQFGALTALQIRDINDFIRIVLDPLTAHLGSKFNISSWWRSPKVNQLAGGVSDSLHLRGTAIDFYFQENGIIDNKKVIKAIYDMQLPFTEIVFYGSKTAPKSLHLAFDYKNPVEKQMLFKKPDGDYELLTKEFIYNNFLKS